MFKSCVKTGLNVNILKDRDLDYLLLCYDRTEWMMQLLPGKVNTIILLEVELFKIIF